MAARTFRKKKQKQSLVCLLGVTHTIQTSCATIQLSIMIDCVIYVNRNLLICGFNCDNYLYIADLINVALGIGRLLFGGHSSKSLHCSIWLNAQCPITDDQFPKQPFLI